MSADLTKMGNEELVDRLASEVVGWSCTRNIRSERSEYADEILRRMGRPVPNQVVSGDISEVGHVVPILSELRALRVEVEEMRKTMLPPLATKTMTEKDWALLRQLFPYDDVTSKLVACDWSAQDAAVLGMEPNDYGPTGPELRRYERDKVRAKSEGAD